MKKIELSVSTDNSKLFRDYLRDIEIVSDNTILGLKRRDNPKEFLINSNVMANLERKNFKMVDLLVDLASMIDIEKEGLLTISFLCGDKRILDEMVDDDLLIRCLLKEWKGSKREFYLEEKPNSNPLAVTLVLDINGPVEKKLGKEKGVAYWCNEGPVFNLPSDEDTCDDS